MKLLNLDMIVSCEITREHISDRYYIRKEQVVTKYFGLVVKHLARAVGDRSYIRFDVPKFTTPLEFTEKNNDRYEIVGDQVICKAEVRLQFVDGQSAKYYFSKYEDAVKWAKSLDTSTPFAEWLQI
jgi:hypothetical protein